MHKESTLKIALYHLDMTVAVRWFSIGAAIGIAGWIWGTSSIPVWALIIATGFGWTLLILLLTEVLLSFIAFHSKRRVGHLAHGDFMNFFRLVHPGLLRAGTVFLGVVVIAVFCWVVTDSGKAIGTALYGSLLAVALLWCWGGLAWIDSELRKVRQAIPHVIHRAEHIIIISPELKKKNTRRLVIASIVTFVGICGMIYSEQKMPSDFSFVFETAKWAFGMTASTIIALSGLPGIAYGRLTSRHLKIIDLIWVLASAVAVIFSVVQVTQLYADAHRATIARNVENARAKAKDYIGGLIHSWNGPYSIY